MDTKTLSSIWHAFLIRGIVMILFGIALIVWPLQSLVILTFVAGLFFLVDGVIATVLELVHALKKEANGMPLFFQGVFEIALGAIIFTLPQMTLGLLVLLFALFAIVSGIVLLFTSLRNKDEDENPWMLLLLSIISIIFGIVLLIYPQGSLKLFAVLNGFFYLVSGIFYTVIGFQVRKAMKSAVVVAQKAPAKKTTAKKK